MSSKRFEYLTTRTIVASIPVDWKDSRKTSGSRQSEGGRIFALLQRLCAPDTDDKLLIADRAHNIVSSATGGGSSWVERPDGCQGQLVLAAVDDRDQRIRLGFKLVRQKSGDGRLTLSYDPTAVLTGAEIHPTLADGKTGAMIPFPSSSPAVTREMFLLGPSFLESLQHSLSKSKVALFDEAIRADDIRIARVQWAVDLATPEPDRFLDVLSIIYGLWFSGDNAALQLATYYGLTLKIGAGADKITAVTLTQRHGRKPLWTLKFTHGDGGDGREGVATTGTATSSKCLRLEITAHPDGIAEMVSEARRLNKRDPSLLGAENARPEVFETEDPEPTLWWLERAVYVLSQRPSEEDLARTSFADWLIPHVLRDVLRLDIIAAFTAEDLAKLGALDDRVARAWRAAQYSAETNWATAIAEKASCDPQTVYNRRKKWLKEFNIDIGAPFESYSGLLAVGPFSLTNPEARSALTAAISHGDAAQVLEMFTSALKDFDRHRRVIVGGAIDAPRRRFAIEVVKTPTTSAAIEKRKAARRRAALPAPAKRAPRPPAATGGRKKTQRPRTPEATANRARETKPAKQTAVGAEHPSAGRAGARQNHHSAPSTRRTRRQGGRKR